MWSVVACRVTAKFIGLQSKCGQDFLGKAGRMLLQPFRWDRFPTCGLDDDASKFDADFITTAE
ncbi:hypothetical protein D3C80_1798640 [compost metagenome]